MTTGPMNIPTGLKRSDPLQGDSPSTDRHTHNRYPSPMFSDGGLGVREAHRGHRSPFCSRCNSPTKTDSRDHCRPATDEPEDFSDGRGDQPQDETAPAFQAVTFPQREQQAQTTQTSIATSSSTLARTGSDATSIALLIGLLALGTGSIIVIATRRRESTTSSAS